MSMRDAFRKAGFDVPDEQERRPEMPRPRSGNRTRQDRDHRADSRQQEQTTPKFPDSYFVPDEGGIPCLQTDFVSKKLVDPLARQMSEANPRLTTGQIRRFFNHCREIERRLKVDGESWLQVAADFERLSAHAQNASSGQKIPREFQGFIDRNVNRVTFHEDPRFAFLEGFMPHFEALVGFGAAHMRNM